MAPPGWTDRTRPARAAPPAPRYEAHHPRSTAMHRFLAVTAALLAPLALVGAADDKEMKDTVPNPAYKHWSAFKPGAMAVHKQVIVDKAPDGPNSIDATGKPEGASEELLTYKLLSVTPEKAVIEMVETELAPGSETEHAPVKITYHAKLHPKHKGKNKDKVGKFKETTEEVEVGGMKIKANVVESEIKEGDEVSHQKLWWSNDVPGGLVKEVVTKSQGGKVYYETTTTLLKFSKGGG
jgi:hypothetical protein